jgi:leucyl-tRNA synthetase
MKSYDHKKIEKKWQKEWDRKKLYHSNEKGKKMYVLDMFPYPSGDGLHVGHPKGYIATDIVSRHARMQGKSVLHPMGWDAFGLPAENYAIKNKVHPRKAVEKNVKRFKEQLKLIGLDYDWSREINTTDPEFYKWTQWIFLKLYEKGLAYQSFEPINWCPSCQTGLANEDLEGNACERCGTVVEKRPMRQWVLKITDYAERLLQDLELLPEWQASIKESQRNWIGKSEGAEIDFPLIINNGRKYKYVILHGFQSGPDRPRWVYAKQELEKLGHEVIIPELPNTNHPKEEEQVAAALAATDYDENTVLCGHSLGAVVALKVLEKLDKPIARLITVGGFVSRNFKDRPRNFDKTFSWKFDGDKIRSNVKSVTILHDPRDYAISDAMAKELSEVLKTPVTLGQSVEPHFTGNKEPDVLMWLRPTIRVFTTRPDTLFGATYMVLSPEHPWVQLAIRDDHKGVLKNQVEVKAYVAKAAAKTEIERQENKEKTGVKLEGVEAINPASGEKIPVYVADYVLANYGTGAIMAVPAHDERDYEFAKKFDIPIRQVVAPISQGRAKGDTVRSGVPFQDRDAVMCIVKHWEKNEYLCQQWNAFPDVRNLISGGIDAGEDPITAGKREIREESGYVNAKFVRKLSGYSFVEFYHQVKKTNVRARFQYLYYELADGEQVAVSDEEKNLHSSFWKKEAEVLDFLTIAEKNEIWTAFKNGGKDDLYVGEGRMVNSGEFDSSTTEVARLNITDKFGTKKTTYKIRDWVFSRQRYWGEPIPIIHCPKCGTVPVPEKDLPVKLPEVKKYEPTGTGESPLALMTKWVNVKCPVCKGKAKRETNTMPQWAGSSWYWLRFMDPKNKKALMDRRKEKFWAPVDLYVGGAEHATRHLIYGRFWHKFLQDIGVVSTPEPFTRLISVGLIQAEDGRKMSKRYGNVINPDDIVASYGADTLRVYEMFMGPFSDAIAWKTASLIGARRFLERVWRLQERLMAKPDEGVERELHKTVKKVGEDIANFKFNTAISQMMIFVNAAEAKGITKKQYQSFIAVLAPFAPHIAEELWRELGNKKTIHLGPWPKFDAKKLVADEVTVVVQVNGKVRAQILVPAGSAEELVRASAEEAVAKWLEGKAVRKAIHVPDRLLNFVIDAQ